MADPARHPPAEKPRFGKDQPSWYCGKPGRSGPKPGNRNAIRHGLRGSNMPKGCKYVAHRVNALRRRCEDAVLALKGEVSLTDAAAINSVLKWERHGLLAAHWLRHQIDTLSPMERLKFSEAIARASDRRDFNIRALGLERDAKESIIDALYTGLPGPKGDNGIDSITT